MIVCGTKDNSLRERLLCECDVTLSKAISANHAAEATRKYAPEILRSQPSADIDKIFKKKLNKSNHNTRNQNTRGFIKKCKFCDSSHPRGKCPAYGKVCHVCNERNHFKVCCPRVSKKVHQIEKDDSEEHSDQTMNFLLKLLVFRILYILTKSRMKLNNSTLEWDSCFIQN